MPAKKATAAVPVLYLHPLQIEARIDINFLGGIRFVSVFAKYDNNGSATAARQPGRAIQNQN
jgi:hypothetical protein